MNIMPVARNVYQNWCNLPSMERGAIAATAGVMLLLGAAIVKNSKHDNTTKCEEYMNAQADYNKASVAIDNSDTLDLQKYLQ